MNGNFELDLTKFQAASTVAAPLPASTSAEIAVTSNPAGAEIQLDGTFVGNTPSTIGVSSGDHTIDVAKSGYKTWERKIKVTSGKIDIAADLEAVTSAPAAPATSTNPPQQQ